MALSSMLNEGFIVRFDPISLRLFVMACKLGSITSSAEALHIALAAASRRIANLESDVGTPLLERLPRGVEPTQAGYALLHHAGLLVEQFDRMRAEMLEYAQGVRGHVRVWANRSAVLQFLPDDITMFLQQFPELRIELKEGFSKSIIQALRDQQAEVGIFESTVNNDDLQTFLYRSDRLVVLIYPGHSLASRDEVHFADLLGEEFISLRPDTALQTMLQEQTSRVGATLRIRVQVHGFDSLCRMVATGIGIGVLPHKAICSHLPGPLLQSIPLLDPWAQRNHYVGYRNYETLSKAARSFVDFLRKQSADHGNTAAP